MKPDLSNGQSHFWQWDTNQRIKVDGAAKELHYAGIDGAAETDEDGWAVVPDELLQNSGTLLGWAYLTDHTIERFVIGVSPRGKPPDYVFTPTEVKTWTELAAEIQKLKETGVSTEAIDAAVNKWLEQNPITVEETDPTVPEWAKAREKPEYTAEEVGALSADTLQAATENALAQAKASGAFDGAKGEKGDPGDPGAKGEKGDPGDPGAKGKDGYTPVKGTDYWTAEDKAEIVADVLEALPDGDEVAYG